MPVPDLLMFSLYLTATSHVLVYGCCLLSNPCAPSRVSLCCPYSLPRDAAEQQDPSPSHTQVEGAQFCAPSPTPYAPDLKFCEWNMIPDHCFCDPSTKLAFTSEEHSPPKIAFPRAHNIPPPSFQTAELMMKGSDTSSVKWSGPSDSWKALNASATQMP